MGIALAIFNKKQNKKDEDRKKEEEERLKIEKAKLSLIIAAEELSYAVAMAHKRGKPNGEIEEGLALREKALKDLREVEREQIIKF